MADDGEIRIKTAIDNSGLDKGLKTVQKKLKDAGKAMDGTSAAAKQFDLAMDGASASASSFSDSAEETAKSTEELGDAMEETAAESGEMSSAASSAAKSVVAYASAVAGAIAAAKGVYDAIMDTTEAYKTQALAETQLETAAKNNPYLNELNVRRLKEYASELQGISTVGDEQLLPMMAQLAASGRTQEEIQKIMKAALDASASGAISLESAVQGLNQSFSGQAGMLSRTLPMLKDLTEEELKQGKAVDAVAKAFNGMAEEAANATGTAQQLSNAWGDFKEHIGEGFETAIAPIRKFFTNLLSDINESIGKAKALAKANKNISSGEASIEDYDVKRKDVAKKAAAARDERDKAIEARKRDLGNDDEAIRLAKEGGYFDDSAIITANAEFEALKKELDDLTKKRAELFEKKATEQYDAILKAEAEAKAAEEEAKRKKAESKREHKAEAKKTESYAPKEKSAAEYARENTEALENQLKLMELKAKYTGEEVSAQDRLNAYLQSYTNLLTNTNGKIKEGSEIEKERRKQLEAAAKERAEGYARENTEALENRLKAMETEAKAKGESVTAQDKYNAYLQSYIDLLTKTKNTITKGMPIEKERKEQLEAARKAAEEAATAEKKLAAAIKYTGKVAELIKKAQDAASPAGQLKGQLAEIKKAKEAIEAMSDKEVKKAQKDSGTDYSKEELLKGLAEAEKQITTDKVKELTEIEKSGFARIKEENEKLLELKKTINAMEIEDADFKKEQLKKIDDEIARNNKETFSDLMTQIQGYVSQTTEIMQRASALALETVRNNSRAELATLETQYLKGEISEEEYEKKKIDAKKKAAKEEYKIQMFQWSASILTATANIAQGVTKAIADGGIAGLITGALVAAAGGVQIASIIASKPTPPSFAGGGIVQGNSYTGDKVRANVNSGEMILNATQQKALWEVANGRNANGNNGANIIINNSASNIVNAQPRLTKDQIEIMIDARVNDSLKNGRYDQSLTMANQGMGGDYYGI